VSEQMLTLPGWVRVIYLLPPTVASGSGAWATGPPAVRVPGKRGRVWARARPP